LRNLNEPWRYGVALDLRRVFTDAVIELRSRLIHAVEQRLPHDHVVHSRTDLIESHGTPCTLLFALFRPPHELWRAVAKGCDEFSSGQATVFVGCVRVVDDAKIKKS
jgi:hypothetical protein